MTEEILRRLGWLWMITAVLLGTTVGSFLNVVIARMPAGQSVVTPRSRCPRCGTPIAWYDNLPVLSWLILRARCRACREPISVRYPLVELAGGAAAWLAVARHGPSWRALAEFTLVAFLLALAAIDLDTWLLPHRLTWPLMAFGLLAAGLGVAPAPSLGSSAMGAGLGFGGFALVSMVGERILKREALGFGDVYLLGGLGAWLGVEALLPLLLLASLQGSVVGVALILLGRSQPGPPAESPPPATGVPAAPATPAATAATAATAAMAAMATTAPPPGGSPVTEGDDDAWVPPRHALPFGPFLVAGALEWLWLGERLAAAVPLLGVFR